MYKTKQGSSIVILDRDYGFETVLVEAITKHGAFTVPLLKQDIEDYDEEEDVAKEDG